MHAQIADMLAFRFRNSVIMAYGSSGAGKTYTIEVRSGAESLCGCIPSPG